MTEQESEINSKEGKFLPIRERQRIHTLLDQNEYELAHSRDNGRAEKFPTLEILEKRMIAFTDGTSYLKRFNERIQEIEKRYGNSLTPRDRSHKGSFEILKAEAILRYDALLQLGKQSGIITIDRRPGGAQETIEMYNLSPYEGIIPYFLEKLSKGGNMIAITDGEPNMRKSTSMIWLLQEMGGMTYILDGEEVKIPEYNLRTCVHWTPDSLMDAIEKGPPRATSFIPDDWGQGANSKTHQSIENLITSELVQTARDTQYSLFMTTPVFTNIDKQSRRNIQEYFQSTGEQGLFYFGKPVFDQNDRMSPEFFTEVSPDYQVNGVPALLSRRSYSFPYIPDQDYKEYRKNKQEVYAIIRREQGELLEAKRNNRVSTVLESRTRRERAEYEATQQHNYEEEMRAKRLAKIHKGKEIKEARERGLTVREITQKFAVSPNKVPEYIEFYEIHKQEIGE